MICFKRKICKENKSKKNKNALYMIARVSSRRCGSYRMYLEGDSPHQTIMIVCELKVIFSYLKLLQQVDTYAIL